MYDTTYYCVDCHQILGELYAPNYLDANGDKCWNCGRTFELVPDEFMAIVLDE